MRVETERTTLHMNHYEKQEMYPKQGQNTNREEVQKARWATFTYCGSEVGRVTKLLRNTNVTIAYKLAT
jgi:predicted metal-dependent RNase